MRERLLEEGADECSIAEGLAGLDSEKAWKMRKKFLKEGVKKSSIVRGLVGGPTTFVWRLNGDKG